MRTVTLTLLLAATMAAVVSVGAGCGLLLETDPVASADVDGGGRDGAIRDSASGEAGYVDASADVSIDGGRVPGTGAFHPAYSLDTAEGCPETFLLSKCGTSCRRGNVSGCMPGTASIFVDPPVSPWQEVRGVVRGMQGQTPDGFNSAGTTIDEVYVEGVSITTEAPRQHLWTFAAGLLAAGTPGYGGACPCNNGPPPPDLVGDNWTCETGNDSADYENVPDAYCEDVLWDADGDAHGAGCVPVAAPGQFVARLPTPTTARIEVRLMYDDCDDNVGLTVLELEVR